MKNILIHGLGQNRKNWNQVESSLKQNHVFVLCPDLFKLSQSNKLSYRNLYTSFAIYCNKQEGPLNLCGLSLGGILALDYAKEFPQKVNSLVLIGVPYEIPKTLFKLQNLIFKLMPKKTFEKMGTSKNDFCSLVNSMRDIRISENIESITCKSLILCGSRDKINKKSADLFHHNITDSTLNIIPDSSHEVNMDNPNELAKVLLDFWDEVHL